MGYITTAVAGEILVAEGSDADWPSGSETRDALAAKYVERASRRIDQLAFNPDNETPKSPRYTDGYLTDAAEVEDNEIPHLLAVQVALLSLWYLQNPNSFYNKSPAGEDSLCKAMSDIPLSIQTGLWPFVSDDVKIDVDELPAPQQDRTTGGSIYTDVPEAPGGPTRTVDVGTDDQTAAEVPVSSQAFDGNLRPSDNNVQKVAQRLDDLDISDHVGGSYHKIQLIATHTLLTDAAGVGSSGLIIDPAIAQLTFADPLPEGVVEASSNSGEWIGVRTTAPPAGINCIIVEVAEAAGQDPYFSSCIPWMNTWGREIVFSNSTDFFYLRASTNDRDTTALVIQKGNGPIPVGTEIKWFYGRLGGSGDVTITNQGGGGGGGTALEKATNADVDAESDDVKYMTVAKTFRGIARKVVAATTTKAGIIEIASQAEGDAGDATDKAMTPALVQRKIDNIPSGGGGGGTTLAKATNADVDAESDDAKYMTVLKTFRAIARKVKPASLVVRGIVFKATNTEIDNGGDQQSTAEDTKFVSVRGVYRCINRIIGNASESARGIIRIASQSDADTGTNNAKAMTPALVKSRIDTRQATLPALTEGQVWQGDADGNPAAADLPTGGGGGGSGIKSAYAASRVTAIPAFPSSNWIINTVGITVSAGTTVAITFSFELFPRSADLSIILGVFRDDSVAVNSEQITVSGDLNKHSLNSITIHDTPDAGAHSYRVAASLGSQDDSLPDLKHRCLTVTPLS